MIFETFPRLSPRFHYIYVLKRLKFFLKIDTANSFSLDFFDSKMKKLIYTIKLKKIIGNNVKLLQMVRFMFINHEKL